MIKMILAAVAAVGLAGLAAANGPIAGKVTGGCSGCGGSTAAAPLKPFLGTDGCAECERNKKYGLHPLFQRLMFWKGDASCSTCGLKGRLGGCFGGNCAGQATPAFNPYPNGVPGTLVFPQHPYVRSPRDWYEK